MTIGDFPGERRSLPGKNATVIDRRYRFSGGLPTKHASV